MDAIFTLENLVTFLSLSGLEIILGIDNIIFIAIVIYGLPPHRRSRVGFFGLALAIVLRIMMLFGVSWIMTLIRPLFYIGSLEITGRSILLLIGGGFLVVKACKELIEMLKLDSDHSIEAKKRDTQSEFQIILQIIFIDLVLSFDSVIVAVGMANNLYLIIPAILIAMAVMLASAEKTGEFMHSNPSIKVLGLGFVLIIGIALFLSGVSIEIPKGYLYCAFFFSLFIEAINIRIRKKRSKKNES